MDARGATLGEKQRGGGQWPRKVMPLLKLWDRSGSSTGGNRQGRVIVARGEELDLWEQTRDGTGRTTSEMVPMLGYHASVGRGHAVAGRGGGYKDICGLAIVDECVNRDELVLARVNGLVQRVRVVEPEWDAYERRWRPGWLEEMARYDVGEGSRSGKQTTVMALTLKGSSMVTATSSRAKIATGGAQAYLRAHARSAAAGDANGAAVDAAVPHPSTIPYLPRSYSLSFSSLSSPWVGTTVVPLGSKPWSLQQSPVSASSSWLAVGASSTMPLILYDIDSTGLPSVSSIASPRLLGLSTPGTSGKSSIYALATPHPLSTVLNPANTLLAAYYDSTTRLYDLRAPNHHTMMQLFDPISDDPSYSITTGGPDGAPYVITGSARHAAIRIWDVRRPDRVVSEAGPPRSSRTVFAPAHDPSPVYSLACESGKIWGVTDRRAFVLDFEPAATAAAVSGDVVSWYEHEGEEQGKLKRGAVA